MVSYNKQMKPAKFYEKPLNKSKGILDDFAVRKNISTQEGSIERVPTEGHHIANKDYVDAQIAGENHWDDNGTQLQPYLAARSLKITGTGDSSFAGRVGIGTTSPSEKLHIQNSGEVNLILNTNGGVNNAGIYLTEGLEATPTKNGAYVYYDGSANTFNIATGTSSLTNKLTILRDTGNVGIGTTSPGSPLDFGASIGKKINLYSGQNFGIGIQTNTIEFIVPSSGQDFKFGYGTTGSLNNLMIVKGTGKVGIGTTGPDYKLVSKSGGSGEKTTLLQLWSNGVSDNTESAIRFTNSNVGTSETGGGEISVERVSNIGNMKFSVDSTTGGFVERMRIDGDGNVGIGTTSPSEKLEVNGRVIEEGTFAEIYVADGSTAQTIATGATYTKITAFTTNGQSSNCTADATNDKITITKTGRYKVNLTINGSIDTANTQFDGAVFVGGTIQNNIKCYNEFVAADKNCSAHICGFIDITSANTDIDFRVRHDDGGNVDLTLVNCNLNVHYLGKT